MVETWDEESTSVDAQGGGQPLAGVAIGEVINNFDLTGLGRVQVRLPWLPGVEPWARVAALSAGPRRGMYFIPQVGEEVLLAFQHGDIRDAFIVGSLWNGTDQPPSQTPLDPVNRRVIKTPVGHVIELDDLRQSVTITTSTGQKVYLDPLKIELSTNGDTAKLTLETAGTVTLSGLRIELKAPSIVVSADAEVEVSGGASAKLSGGGICEIQGGLVKIN